ncbi:tRNA (adenine-N1)-methyltransferase [bacterium]|nr:tRNA (adenine-N1)-methyltransferase [bacterium]
MSVFQEGELAVLYDTKGRRYLITLERGKAFHYHSGVVEHEAIIGKEEGSVVFSSLGSKLMVFRPSLEEYILEMPRGAQVMYAKDCALLGTLTDIKPEDNIVEAGTGSGALTLFLCRLANKGTVYTYEIREDFAKIARQNLERWGVRNFVLKLKDINQGIDEENVDKVVLDLPEPWLAIEQVKKALRPGGFFASFLPTVLQIHRLVLAMKETGGFAQIRVQEVLVRPWVIEERIARPELRMVSHTGFIIVARRLSDS